MIGWYGDPVSFDGLASRAEFLAESDARLASRERLNRMRQNVDALTAALNEMAANS